MKIDLNFIPLNTVPKGVKGLGVYDKNDKKVGDIPLGNLAPKSTGNMLYRFGALSDVHLPYNTGSEDFTRALNYFNDIEKVDFICISGDMGSTGVDSEWANFKAHVDAHSPNTPVHISAGNHDAGQSTPKTYDYPIPYTGNPLYYSFTQGNDVFIMFGLTSANNPPFSKESLQWLYETLEENRNKRCFVFQHMMRKGHAGDASGRYSWDGLNNTNGQVFLSLMEHYKNVLWFHGHSHNEFEHQDTLSLPNSNYDRAFGCHSIHVPSCCLTRNEDNGYDYEDSEGYVVDVYENGIHLRGRDFIAGKFLPIASYWIDTTPTTITAKSYTDSTGTINTGSSTPSEPSGEITLPENSELIMNQRYSKSGGGLIDANVFYTAFIPIENNTDYVLNIKNNPFTLNKVDGTHTIYLLDSNKSYYGLVNGVAHIGNMGVFSNNDCDAKIEFNSGTGAKYIVLSISAKTDDGSNKSITEDDIKDVIITLEKVENESSGITLPEGTTYTLNARDSYSSKATKNEAGMIRFYIPCEADTTYKLSVENLPISIYSQTAAGNTASLFCWDANKTNVSYIQDGGSSSVRDLISAGLITVTNNDKSFSMNLTTSADAGYIALSLVISTTEAITEDDIKDIIITLEPYTNLLPLSVDADGNDFVGTNGEDGYITGYRIRSNGEMAEQSTTCATGFIPVEKNDIISIANITCVGNDTNERIALYDSSKVFIKALKFVGDTINKENAYIFKASAQGYIRFSASIISEESIVTIKEVTNSGELITNVLHLAVNKDGSDFVGNNGEDGYKTGYRINGNGEEEENVEACVSGFISIAHTKEIRIHGVTQWDLSETDGSTDRIAWYNNSKEFLGLTTLMKTNGGITMEDDNTTYRFSTNYWFAGVAFIRFSTGIIDENTIVTLDEPIIKI